MQKEILFLLEIRSLDASEIESVVGGRGMDEGYHVNNGVGQKSHAAIYLLLTTLWGVSHLGRHCMVGQ